MKNDIFVTAEWMMAVEMKKCYAAIRFCVKFCLMFSGFRKVDLRDLIKKHFAWNRLR